MILLFYRIFFLFIAWRIQAHNNGVWPQFFQSDVQLTTRNWYNKQFDVFHAMLFNCTRRTVLRFSFKRTIAVTFVYFYRFFPLLLFLEQSKRFIIFDMCDILNLCFGFKIKWVVSMYCKRDQRFYEWEFIENNIYLWSIFV